MLDTVKINILVDDTKWVIFNHSNFLSNSNYKVFGNYEGRTSYFIQNRDKNSYIPNTYIKVSKGNLLEISMEFSIPKLLFGSSYFEYQFTDSEEVYKKLKFFLERNYISIKTEILKQAVVSRFAVCKNFYLPTKIGRPYQILWTLNSTRLEPHFRDYKATKYTAQQKNWYWYSLSASSNRRTITIYDKWQEILSSAKTKQEKTIKNKLVKWGLSPNVLRIETTFKGKSVCREKFYWRKSKTNLTLWVLLGNYKTKEIMMKEQKKIIKILKTDLTVKDISLYPIEDILSRLSKTTLTQAEQFQMATLLMLEKQAWEEGARIMLKSIFWNTQWARRYRNTKRIYKRLIESKAETPYLSELTGFLEESIK